MTVSLNHGDALILLINAAIFSWLQLTALNDWFGLPSNHIFAVTGTRDKTIRVMGIDCQGKQ